MPDPISGPDPATVNYDHAQIWKPGTLQDPARYTLDPGNISGKGEPSPGNLRHIRPYIINGNMLFDFPVGPEGFRWSGTAALGLHRPIGGEGARGRTTNFNEARVEMSGIFPGVTSVNKMNACEKILTHPQRNGMRLIMTGIYPTLFVLPESWDFTRDPEDRTHSISYTISFVVIGVGKKVSDPKGKQGRTNPTVKKTKPKGKPAHIFTVKAGARTLQAIARVVYKDAKQWQKLVRLNQGQINKWVARRPTHLQKLATHQLPTYRWPIGTKFRY